MWVASHQPHQVSLWPKRSSAVNGKCTWLVRLGTQEAIITQDSREKPGLNMTASPFPELSPVFPCEAAPTDSGRRLVPPGFSFLCPFLTLGFMVTAALNAKELTTKASVHSDCEGKRDRVRAASGASLAGMSLPGLWTELPSLASGLVQG